MKTNDFSRFSSRNAAEAGSWMTIVDPWSAEELTDEEGKICRVQLRGSASSKVQQALRRKQAAKMKAESEEDVKTKVTVMEDVHMDMVDAAVIYVMGFENVVLDGKLLTGDETDARRFLELTFPEMKVDGFEKDGVTQKFSLANKPFAVQISEFIGSQAKRMGNVSER